MLAQREQIKEFLLMHKKISTWEAIQKFRITRLGAHIYELRRRGMNIAAERKRNPKTGLGHNFDDRNNLAHISRSKLSLDPRPSRQRSASTGS